MRPHTTICVHEIIAFDIRVLRGPRSLLQSYSRTQRPEYFPPSDWNHQETQRLWGADYLDPSLGPPETFVKLADLSFPSFCRCQGYEQARRQIFNLVVSEIHHHA